jgi:hypothetical protein
VAVTSLGPCCREGCDAAIVVIDTPGRAYVPAHDCKGKPYTTKKREYTDGH